MAKASLMSLPIEQLIRAKTHDFVVGV